MLRSIMVAIIAAIGILVSNADDIKLEKSKCLPEEGGHYSTISELTFKFSYDDVDLGAFTAEDVGIEACQSRKRALSLYKGTPSDGELVFSFYTTLYSSDEDFRKDGYITLDLGTEYVLEPNQLYTLSIPASAFRLVDSTGNYDLIVYNLEDSYEFYGSEPTSNNFVLTNVSPANLESLDILNKVLLNFNYSINLSIQDKVFLYEDGELLKEGTLSLSEDAENTVVATFDETKLYVSHNYTVKIPEGAILSEATGEAYKEIVLNYSGASYDYIGYGRCNPGNNATVSYLGAVHVPLNCDAKYNIARAHAKAYFYKEGVEDALAVLDCQIGVDSRSWDIPVWNFDLEPGARYRIEMPADQYTLWYYNDNGGITQVKESSNEALVLNYTVAENPVMPTPVTLGTATPAEGEALETLENLQIFFNTFTYDAVTYTPEFANSTLETGYNTIYLYEGDKEEPVKAINVDLKWNNNNLYWIAPNAPVNYKMYEGVDYKVVVPAGMFISSHNYLGKVVANPEFVLNLKGASSLAGLGLSALSIAEGGKHSHVGVVSTVANETVSVADDAKFVLKNGEAEIAKVAVKAHNDNGTAFVYGDFAGVETEKGKEYTVVLPKGSLIGADGIVTNPEVSANFRGLDEVVEIPETQYVNVSLTIGNEDSHALVYAHPTEKGKDAKVNISAGSLWKLSSLTLNKEAVDVENVKDGEYTIPAEKLNDDASLVAEFAYNGSPEFDFTTSVDGIVDGCDYRVHSEGEMLVIENVPANAHVAIYSVAGMLVKDGNNTADTDMIRINLNPGVYVVIINNDALKVRHQ